MRPERNIRQMLEDVGYPFKSKYHSKLVDMYQRRGNVESVLVYTKQKEARSGVVRYSEHLCPKKLMYQFQGDFDIKVSPKCCDELKKKPLHKYQKENGKPYAIIGIMPDEGGERESAKCAVFKNNKLKAFQPLVPVTKKWEDWFIAEYNIEICEIYRDPYNFHRTGCKGCPFALKLQDELDTLAKFFPAERKQCELIWAPIYTEYRRIGYRLKKPQPHQMTVEEFLEENK